MIVIRCAWKVARMSCGASEGEKTRDDADAEGGDHRADQRQDVMERQQDQHPVVMG